MALFNKLFAMLFVVSVVLPSMDCLKILAIFPYTGKSHHYVYDPLVNRLADKGHEVTVISHFPSTKKINRIDIGLNTDMSVSEDFIDLSELEEIPSFLSMIQVAVESEFLYSHGVSMCNLLLNSAPTMDLVKNKVKFDVALVEQFNTDCAMALIHKLDIPSVGITSDTMMPWHYERYGVTWNPSYIPCHNLGYGTRPVFWQRVTSFLICGAMRLGYCLRSTVPTHDMHVKYLGNDIPTLDALVKNVSMLLVNAYFPVSGAFQLPPSVKEVGGLYLKNSGTLPQDIKKYIEESADGVIYFSMGSMIKASSMSHEKLAAFQQAFAELPQRVLWKWENESMPGNPENVMVKKWLPQLDILSHKNVKAFISHGGMLSTTEAAHCGVPIISIPLYGDQFANAAAASDSGLGTTLLYKDITKETVLEALRKILDPSMQKSAKKLSELWKDRPMPPLETAVYWIEHVARHGGAHMRPASADMPLFSYLLLDVIGFLAVVAFICAYVSYKILMRICSKKSKSKRE